MVPENIENAQSKNNHNIYCTRIIISKMFYSYVNLYYFLITRLVSFYTNTLTLDLAHNFQIYGAEINDNYIIPIVRNKIFFFVL